MSKSKSIKSNVIYEDGFFMGEKDIKIYYKFAIAFVLLFALIYAIFEIYGRYLNKKWGKKHE